VVKIADWLARFWASLRSGHHPAQGQIESGFDEKQLMRELDTLPRKLRGVFAAACAERQLPNYVRASTAAMTGDPGEMSAALADLWDALEGEILDTALLRKHLDRCLNLVPGDYDNAFEGQEYAEDAAASIAYALWTQLSDSSQEAGWAAERARNSLDTYVASLLRLDMEDFREAQTLIDSHVLIQAELQRQRADMADLQIAALNVDCAKEIIAKIRHRAEEDSAIFFGPTA
jgi:uncharacterized protein